jgi:hypothetical protein
MTEYHNHGVNLRIGQAIKICKACKKSSSSTIRLSKANLHGDIKIPLTQTQINKIKEAKNGVQLTLSEAQLKHMEKTGGFIPLLTLFPIIASALGAAGGVAGGVASAVSSAKSVAEQARHNRAIEEQLKSGSGVVSNVVGKIPVIGSYLEPLLQKIGLGLNSNDIKKLNKDGCVCYNGLEIHKIGNGLYLGHVGEGLFLDRDR